MDGQIKMAIHNFMGITVDEEAQFEDSINRGNPCADPLRRFRNAPDGGYQLTGLLNIGVESGQSHSTGA
jgi:hypothetical protein